MKSTVVEAPTVAVMRRQEYGDLVIMTVPGQATCNPHIAWTNKDGLSGLKGGLKGP